MDQMRKSAPRSFSLVELLVVMAILGLIAMLAAPTLQSVVLGTNLSRSGQMVGDQIRQARQEAVAKNREVRVLLYRFNAAGPGRTLHPGWSAIQSWRIEQTDSDTVSLPVGKMEFLPDDVVLSDDRQLSPLLTAYTAVVETNLSHYGAVSVAEFRFRPNGFLSGNVTTNNNYLTLQNVHAGGNPPQNYYSVQINPVTGKVTSFRP